MRFGRSTITLLSKRPDAPQLDEQAATTLQEADTNLWGAYTRFRPQIDAFEGRVRVLAPHSLLGA
jgi:hypothetical protein